MLICILNTYLCTCRLVYPHTSSKKLLFEKDKEHYRFSFERNCKIVLQAGVILQVSSSSVLAFNFFISSSTVIFLLNFYMVLLVCLRQDLTVSQTSLELRPPSQKGKKNQPFYFSISQVLNLLQWKDVFCWKSDLFVVCPHKEKRKVWKPSNDSYLRNSWF